MSSEIGRESRRGRISRSGSINLVALDHGPSMGWTKSQEPPPDIARSCQRLGLSGAVCHVGLLRELRSLPLETFLQLHASTPADRTKSVVASPQLAARADCIGVAVEYRASGDSCAMATTAALIQSAQDHGLLVLVMANYEAEDYQLAATAIVGAAQMGADYIKVRIPSSVPTAVEVAHLRRVIAGGPPTLLAGGDAARDLGASLAMARELGMQGSCIGRHYFNPCARADAVAAVKAAFR